MKIYLYMSVLCHQDHIQTVYTSMLIYVDTINIEIQRFEYFIYIIFIGKNWHTFINIVESFVTAIRVK